MPTDPRNDTNHDPKRLSREDQAVFEVLEKAQQQYRSYLEAAQVANLARLVTTPSSEQPPRTDLPLTLTVG
jgi:NADH:ubiquinone oxidoreductase subunit E